MASTTWPTMTDYQEAVQAPTACFADRELITGSAVLNKLGLPQPICGQFASVYELENGAARWAIKCFLRNIPDLHHRYEKIASHLGGCGLPYFVTFDYLEKGIRVRGDFYPIVKMEWVEGLALNHFIERNVSNATALGQLEERWLALLEDLQQVRVAHADLQHGNVLVASDGSLRLIDYDGMWVPKLEGQKSNEVGHPSFQSPLRSADDFHEDLDQFAGDVIHIALRALMRQPGLWEKYNNGDNLLFRRQDFLDPAASQLLPELRALDDDEIKLKLEGLIQACGSSPGGRPRLLLRPKRGTAKTGDAAGGWVSTTKKSAAGVSASPAPPPPQTARIAAPVLRPAVPSAPIVRPARAPAPPARAQGAGGWLDDHVTATSTAPSRNGRPAPAPRGPRPSWDKRPPGDMRPPGYTRLMLHILLLAAVTTFAVKELLTLVGGSGDRADTILMSGFGLAVGLGVLSLVSLFVMRAMHHMVSTMFFGVTLLVMLLCMFSELLTVAW